MWLMGQGFVRIKFLEKWEKLKEEGADFDFLQKKKYFQGFFFTKFSRLLISRCRNVNLHPSERIPAGIAPFGGPETIPLRAVRGEERIRTGMEVKIPARTLQGGERGSCISPRGFPESVYI
jgi:hypothetical protein